jgi:hypothetical protein
MIRRISQTDTKPEQPLKAATATMAAVAAPRLARGSNSERRATTVIRNDHRALKSKQALHRGLLSLIAEKEFSEILVDDILARSRVSRATYYRHYPTKEALLEQVGNTEIERLVELSVPLLSSEDTRASCLALCRYVKSHRALWSALLTGGAAGAMRDIYYRLWVERGPKQIDTKSDIPLDLGTSWGVA